jgi:ADP-ribose pyrophosphatase YjhB (NUDIX family)
MKNFPIIDKETGREYWISRSVCVLTIVKAFNRYGEECILAVQRGKGTPDPEYIGSYCLPCGYVDFDETIKQAAARELKEETGLTFPISNFNLIYINDSPESDKRQNITFRYLVKTDMLVEDLELMFTTKNSEENEVSSIRFIRTKDVDLYDWAFNHEELIKTYDKFTRTN